jgi:hypothetical protein
MMASNVCGRRGTWVFELRGYNQAIYFSVRSQVSVKVRMATIKWRCCGVTPSRLFLKTPSEKPFASDELPYVRLVEFCRWYLGKNMIRLYILNLWQLKSKFSFISKWNITKYHSGDQVKETEIGRTCSKNGREEKCMLGFSAET